MSSTSEPDQQTIKPELSLTIQQAIGKLNLRISDMMEELNKTLKTCLDEIQAKNDKIMELQVNIKKVPST
jgi:hypothetical protein